jgi:hypothetical protein
MVDLQVASDAIRRGLERHTSLLSGDVGFRSASWLVDASASANHQAPRCAV